MTAAQLKLTYKYLLYRRTDQLQEIYFWKKKTGLTPPVPLLLLAQTKELDPLQGFHLGRVSLQAAALFTDLSLTDISSFGFEQGAQS